MMSKKQLAIKLSKLKSNPKPKLKLEQYEIPSELAADILHEAYMQGDIENKTIADFGCGIGRLGIGAALLGAKKVICIDIDKNLLEIAKQNAKSLEIKNIEFIQKDVADFNRKVDTVIQNPPFGIQSEKLDRLFLKKAIECAKKIYSLHKGPEARKFLENFIENNNGKIQKILKFKFQIPYTFKFHRKPKIDIDVDLYVIKRC